MVKPSAALTLLALSLKTAIELASDPNAKAAVYVPATRDAVRLATKLAREFNACCWREDMAASLRKPSTWSWPAGTVDHKTSGNWTGD